MLILTRTDKMCTNYVEQNDEWSHNKTIFGTWPDKMSGLGAHFLHSGLTGLKFTIS